MEINNDFVMNELKSYLKNKGIKNKHVAEKVGLSNTSISLFLQGKRELARSKLQKIYELMIEEG